MLLVFSYQSFHRVVSHVGWGGPRNPMHWFGKRKAFPTRFLLLSKCPNSQAAKEKQVLQKVRFYPTWIVCRGQSTICLFTANNFFWSALTGVTTWKPEQRHNMWGNFNSCGQSGIWVSPQKSRVSPDCFRQKTVFAVTGKSRRGVNLTVARWFGGEEACAVDGWLVGGPLIWMFKHQTAHAHCGIQRLYQK